MRLVLLGLLVGGCQDGVWREREARKPPQLNLSETEADLGIVRQGDPARHAFTIGNDGDLDLSVIRWRSASDCSVTLDGPVDIPAGGKRTLAVAFDTDRVSGRQRRTVTLYTNDPARRSTLLTLSAEVELDAVARPDRVYLGAAPRGARVGDAFSVLTADGVHIEAVEAPGPRLEVETPARGGAPVVIVVSPRAPLGRFTEQVQVQTSSARHPLITVAVTGTVGRGLTASPAELTFGELRADSMPVRETLVQNHGKRPVEILAADSTASFATVTVSTVQKGFRYRVGVTVDEAPLRGPFDEVVRLRTDHPAEAVVEIPLRGAFTDRSPRSAVDP